ncbi:hypothetical protein Pint_25288 [Pistacia integerrima]|uniref:Uncharacterized protein n=1 Tax=Pistacia integerrima TaxID=434235 RepID=A0ACC0YG15_9ROSI|nr:hypothetical protein Pint_25288 [Pistacia integerrima]
MILENGFFLIMILIILDFDLTFGEQQDSTAALHGKMNSIGSIFTNLIGIIQLARAASGQLQEMVHVCLIEK